MKIQECLRRYLFNSTTNSRRYSTL